MKRKMMTNRVFLMLGILLLTTLSYSCRAEKNVEIKIKTSAVCGMCKDKIEQGLAYEKGIKDVSLSVETKIVTVKYNPAKITPDQIRKAISKLGYDADEVSADKTAYEKLPACCKKSAEKIK